MIPKDRSLAGFHASHSPDSEEPLSRRVPAAAEVGGATHLQGQAARPIPPHCVRGYNLLMRGSRLLYKGVATPSSYQNGQICAVEGRKPRKIHKWSNSGGRDHLVRSCRSGWCTSSSRASHATNSATLCRQDNPMAAVRCSRGCKGVATPSGCRDSFTMGSRPH